MIVGLWILHILCIWNETLKGMDVFCLAISSLMHTEPVSWTRFGVKLKDTSSLTETVTSFTTINCIRQARVMHSNL